MTPRRPIFAAFLIVASALVGLSLYAYLIATGRGEQRADDDSETLHAIAEGRPADLPPMRITGAWARLERDGLLVPLDGALYLTRAGWARIGRPLSADELRLLRALKAGDRHIPICCLRVASRRGLVIDDFPRVELTPAGRAVLMAEQGVRHA